MRRVLDVLVVLVAAAWFGAGLFLALVAAPAAFAMAPSREVAGNVVGFMLSRWHVLALAAPLFLLAVEWRRWALARSFRVVVLIAALLLISAQVAVDLRVRAMRARALTPISELAPGSPERRAFGMLHGVSMLLMALQVICAGAVAASGRPPEPIPSPSGDQRAERFDERSARNPALGDDRRDQL